MLYRPLETPTRPSLSTRFATALGPLLRSLHRQHQDTAYLDSLTPHHLADLGLRRRDERDYPSLR